MNIIAKSSYLVAGFLLMAFALLPSNTLMARDTTTTFLIADAMQTDIVKSLTGVDFFFGDQPHPEIKRSIGVYTTKRTTNAFAKSDANACQWAFLSAIKTLHMRALIEGGNAVVNIQSVTTGNEFSDADEFKCRAGAVMARVYLKGTAVVL